MLTFIKYLTWIKKIAIIILSVLFACFVIFTFNTPQIGLFEDPVNGGYVTNYPGQGYNGYQYSSWSRGQAWALYGFALSYTHTGKQEYLEGVVNRVMFGWESL